MKKVVKYINQGKKENINEGWKEVALGAAMLLGSTFAGNKLMAQKASGSLDNVETLEKIKSTLENEEGINKLANTINMSPDSLKSYMTKNYQKIESDFEEAAKKKKMNLKLNLSDLDDVEDLGRKMKQGYSISDIDITYDTVLDSGDAVLIKDTVDLDYSGGDMFVTGKFELRSEVLNDINGVMTTIENMGGKILSVDIESSTDTEPIKMGNDVLAEKRANSIESVLNSLGFDGKVNKNLKPNSGPDVYDRNMSDEERSLARKKTAEYRYVTVSFNVVMIDTEVDGVTAGEALERVQVKLVKSKVKPDKQKIPPPVKRKPGKTRKCGVKKKNKKIKPLPCPRM